MLKQMCARSKDPSACDQRVEKRKGEAKSARAACEGKRGAEHDECMVKQICAQEKDAAKCEAMQKERLARRERVHEACKGKRGEELKACIRDNSSQK